MLIHVKIEIPAGNFLKDPQESKLGETIHQQGIQLIQEIGYEAFTFKKLAQRIQSTEATIYRYFENKHQFLKYLYAWYWGWMLQKINMETIPLNGTELKLKKALQLLIQPCHENGHVTIQNEAQLKAIIENEGIKAILTKEIDAQNKVGAFENYKELVSLLSNWILELEPNYPYPQMLITTIIEGAHLQHFFAEHLPRLTNTCEDKDSAMEFYFELIDQLIIKKNGTSN